MIAKQIETESTDDFFDYAAMMMGVSREAIEQFVESIRVAERLVAYYEEASVALQSTVDMWNGRPIRPTGWPYELPPPFTPSKRLSDDLPSARVFVVRSLVRSRTHRDSFKGRSGTFRLWKFKHRGRFNT